jgi:hypothetical protein
MWVTSHLDSTASVEDGDGSEVWSGTKMNGDQMEAAVADFLLEG